MQYVNRIPDLTGQDEQAMQSWFAEMDKLDLLFHSEDRAEHIVQAGTGQPLFSDAEASKAESILTRLFTQFGDQVIEAAYPFFMRRSGIDPESWQHLA
ncbi:hypothetical protein NH8B_0010 [Pseudogulbenkiania sp. NH8B]|uniref:hypothetical protein n=1 Tax=Pseudogulbenkiania sp. (strain NH8B) TaxID=748280 RepID=UPI00022796F2|nr:hypothetical protein [Pseudogulbenkiania sp. NH8B]BAK74859.1 hypothetical protein NH8B_0010 [Pseudogulbenkiania sp. NH8B]